MKNKQEDSGFRQAGPYLSLSYQMVITILVGIFSGSYIDDTYGTKPLYFILFAVVFTVIALVNFIRNAIRLSNEQDRREKADDSK